GSESCPPMLNKDNYVPWSSRLLRYAKSRPNGKLIHNSILNGPYIEAGDQAIQTILLGLPEDIYAAVDSCETAQEIWLRVQQMMKGSDIGIQEKKAKFTSNKGESIESYYHCFLKLMNDLKRNKHFPEKIASNLKFLNNLQQEWSRHKEVDELKAKRLAKTQDPLALMENSNNPYVFPAPHQDQPSFNQTYLQQPVLNPEDITYPTTAMNMALALMAKVFKLNYSTPTNNNQRISSNPRNRQIAQPGMNMGQDRQMQMVGGNGGNQFRQYAGQNAVNPAGYNDVIGNQNQIGNSNLVAARAEGNAAGQNRNQIRCYNCTGVEEHDLMAAAADLDEIEEVNANCILMANLQQASTSGTQTDSAPVYDTDGSAEVHENCDDNEIFNMFTQEEQYTELLEPTPESHQIPQNNNDVIYEDTSEKSTISFLLEEKNKLKSDFKTCEDELLDKQIQLEKRIKELKNIVLKMGQSIQTIHMLSPKPNSFYHTEQKIKVLLENHDPPVVNDSEETLQLAQKSRDKMKQMNKEIKPANYTKINHLSGVKSTIVTLKRVVKQRMTIETHNWSSSTHQELHKIVRDENFPIVNQVDARLQNFKIQFLKEAAKFVGEFKSLVNEAGASLAKHKALELEIERLLKAVLCKKVSDQKDNTHDTSKNTKFVKQPIVDNSPKVGKTNALSNPVTLNSVSTPQESKGVNNDKVIAPGMFRINHSKTSRDEKLVPNTVSVSARKKSITVSQPHVITKKDVNSDLNGLSSIGVDNTKTRRP
nr:hypothetical protein [Tanacetum cinerariifolium]